MKHKLNSKSQAETTDDSSANADSAMSGQPIAKHLCNVAKVVLARCLIITLIFLRIFSNGAN